jgi:hypothetical protein
MTDQNTQILIDMHNTPVGEVRDDIERVGVVWFGSRPAHGTALYAQPPLVSTTLDQFLSGLPRYGEDPHTETNSQAVGPRESGDYVKFLDVRAAMYRHGFNFAIPVDSTCLPPLAAPVIYEGDASPLYDEPSGYTTEQVREAQRDAITSYCKALLQRRPTAYMTKDGRQLIFADALTGPFEAMIDTHEMIPLVDVRHALRVQDRSTMPAITSRNEFYVPFNPTAKCSPTLTQCPRCNNPHNACDRGDGIAVSASSATPSFDLDQGVDARPEGMTEVEHWRQFAARACARTLVVRRECEDLRQQAAGAAAMRDRLAVALEGLLSHAMKTGGDYASDNVPMEVTAAHATLHLLRTTAKSDAAENKLGDAK